MDCEDWCFLWETSMDFLKIFDMDPTIENWCALVIIFNEFWLNWIPMMYIVSHDNLSDCSSIEYAYWLSALYLAGGWAERCDCSTICK